MNSNDLASLRGIGPEELEFFGDEVSPIVSCGKVTPSIIFDDVNSSVSAATLTP